MENKRSLAQGDILFVPAIPPVDFVRIPVRQAIVGYGETSGHTHVVNGTEVQWLIAATDDINAINEFAQGRRNMPVYVEVPYGGSLDHMSQGRVIETDHAPIPIPQGTYRVVRQRMATADSIRPVYD